MSESLAIYQKLKYYTLYGYIRDAEFSPHSLYFPTLHVKGVILRIYGPFPWNQKNKKKSRIRETKHLSTDADSSTDAIGGDRLGQGGYNPDKI